MNMPTANFLNKLLFLLAYPYLFLSNYLLSLHSTTIQVVNHKECII